MKFQIIIAGLMAVSSLHAQTYTLEQCVDMALTNNAGIKKADNNIVAATEQRKEAFTKYFPQLSALGASFNSNKNILNKTFQPSEFIPESAVSSLSSILPEGALAALGSPVTMSMLKSGTVAGVTALQPVFMGGQIVNGNKLAKVGEEVSRLERGMSENEVRLTTAQYYWQVVSLKEKLRTIAKVEAMLSQMEHDVALAVKVGVAQRNDLLQVQL